MTLKCLPALVDQTTMKNVEPQASKAPPLTWDAIQNTLIRRVWYSIIALAFIGLPVSLARITITGWLPAYGVHLAVGCAILAISCLPERAARMVKPIAIVLVLATISLGGIISFGLLSQASAMVTVFFVFSGLLFPARTAIALSVALAVAIAAVGTAFVIGRLQVPFDANEYVRSSIGWVFLLVATTFFGWMVAATVSVYGDSIRALLVQLEHQRDQIAQQAAHDRLTGLPGPTLAGDRLEMALNLAIRNQNKVALLFIDLDGFKAANDSYGHEAGDAVLQAVAARLGNCIRSCDTAARIGGDEFLLILGEITDPAQAPELAARIIASVGTPIPYKEQQLTVGCSIGIALYPEHATDAESLRRAADSAMYAVKRSGKNNWSLATPTIPG